MSNTSRIDQSLNKLFIDFCNLTIATSTKYSKLPHQTRLEKLKERHYNLVGKILEAKIEFEKNELHMDKQIILYEKLDIEFIALEFETSRALLNTLERRRSI